MVNVNNAFKVFSSYFCFKENFTQVHDHQTDSFSNQNIKNINYKGDGNIDAQQLTQLATFNELFKQDNQSIKIEKNQYDQIRSRLICKVLYYQLVPVTQDLYKEIQLITGNENIIFVQESIQTLNQNGPFYLIQKQPLFLRDYIAVSEDMEMFITDDKFEKRNYIDTFTVFDQYPIVNKSLFF